MTQTDSQSESVSDLKELYIETTGTEEVVENQEEEGDDRLDEEGVDLDGVVADGLGDAVEGAEADASDGSSGE